MRECMLASRVETLARVSAPSFLRVYLCFAAAYLLSYVYRNVNAVISPELTASRVVDLLETVARGAALTATR